MPADGDEIGRYLGEAWDRDAVAGRLAPDAVVPRADERRAGGHDGSRALRLPADRREAGVAADQARRRQAGTGRRRVRVSCCASSRRSPSGSPRPTSRSSGRSGPGCSRPRFRVAFDPWSRPGLARLAVGRPRARRHRRGRRLAGRDRRRPGARTGPTARSTRPTGSPSWPRIDVGAAFLSPLLLHAQMVRAIAVTIEPISPLKAIREVEAARTSDVADQRPPRPDGLHRDRARAAPRPRPSRAARRNSPTGTPPSASPATSPSPRASLEELERHCSEIEHAAQMARLELLRLYGQQEEAFTYTLPLCRGLR